jgi:hypothetical protein
MAMTNPTVNEQPCSESNGTTGKPSHLLGMEFQCGFWGLVVLITWAISIFWHRPDLLREGPLWTWILFIGTAFLAVVLFSAIGRHSLGKPGKIKGGLKFCSAFCIVSIALFIYLSGGANSPIVPFYIMTFTLTLSLSETKASSTRFWQFAPILLIVFLLAAPQPMNQIPSTCGQVTSMNETPNTCAQVSPMKETPNTCAQVTSIKEPPDNRAPVHGTFVHPIPAKVFREYFDDPLYYWTVAFGTLLSIFIASISQYFKGRDGVFVLVVARVARATRVVSIILARVTRELLPKSRK